MKEMELNVGNDNVVKNKSKVLKHGRKTDEVMNQESYFVHIPFRCGPLKCQFNQNCSNIITCKQIDDLRFQFWNNPNDPAPTSKERAEKNT
jgi:hypothetical protein